MVNKKVLQEIIQFKNEVDEVVNDLKSGKLQNAVAAEATNAIYEEELIAAVCNGELDKVMSYVAQGADVNATTGWRGSTALMHAAKKGHLEIEKYLREHGATH